MASPSLPPGGLVEGTTLAGKYRVDRMLGAGGMCLVYEAEHIHLRQAVALKLLKPDLAKEANAVARFAREAQAAAKLRSPNVARVFDVDKLPDGQPYITMELLVGNDLGTELQRCYALPFNLAVDYVIQAATGISEAHAVGIVHRDLKPENLFLTDLGEMTERKLLKILDFGIAKNVADNARRLTAPDAVFGTVDYMSPEQIRSAATVDHRTDIWSLGVILFELLTGRTPYSGDARSVIAQIVSDPIAPPSRYVPTLPPALVAVVMKALSKDPAARFQSADELRRALAPFSASIEPITAVLARLPPASVPRRTFDPSRGSLAPGRDARTNLAFESAQPRKAWARTAITLPIFVVLGALAGLALWKRDVILHHRSFRQQPALASSPPPVFEPAPNSTPLAPTPQPTPTAATILGVSSPPDPPDTALSASASPAKAPRPKPKAPSRSSASPTSPAPPSEPPAPTPTTPALPKHL